MRYLFLIPARGGSKGIPGKNLKRVGGIPLVGRACRLARDAAERMEGEAMVLCSTDCEEIARAARQWGGETPFLRPAELATDAARSMDVVLHALGAVAHPVETVILLQPTSPLTRAEDIEGAAALFHQAGAPFLTSVCETEHPVEWQYRLDGDSRLLPLRQGEPATRRQDAPSTYRLNGAIYIMDSEALRQANSFPLEQAVGYVMPAERSVDVDNPADLQAARSVLASRPAAPVHIGQRQVGPGHPCFIIAEAGVNHNGDASLALELVDRAAAAGADAVKFQTFRTEEIASAKAALAAYQQSSVPEHQSQAALLRGLELSPADFSRIKARCDELGIMFLSTPFDVQSADLLDQLEVAAFKIPSGELTNTALLRHVARKGKPMIISTGMADLMEVDAALRACGEEVRRAGAVLLHCVSAYPAEPAELNLRAMATMSAAFQLPVGFSDHTAGLEAAMAAVALGACMVEKHMTLDRTLPGPDHGASIEPDEMAALVRGIRTVEVALGDGHKVRTPGEEDTARVARRSLTAAREIHPGEALRPEMVTARRPGTGMPFSMLGTLLGRRLKRPVSAGELFSEEMFE